MKQVDLQGASSQLKNVLMYVYQVVYVPMCVHECAEYASVLYKCFFFSLYVCSADDVVVTGCMSLFYIDVDLLLSTVGVCPVHTCCVYVGVCVTYIII